ncbi:aldehyde dehydrogenase 3H1 [Pyricularia oryzae 70-15]|uniref:Aldehyde dehydrogenase n=3 Tax=Pyricularia oryzae TaxID=318829 RepID=G4NEX6_PYRO7|nr:aldehyde dehydrogenase 3H1 [Pyricularia oryzae 70-15]EHA48702.1 aldehyde dehydrogenase 3H1 [Pyricularia oryzae 70-15]ELQ36062.1 aldehyde dehydrogenase 3H1 [Pyricularia oryzae Y34]KAI7928923.1 aldehyde dehydrogenase 3H1 [Pyricularia oryzae]KAI7929556.1 aldehyde dehydrogenase 3H1 [Pyricularia oryzae]
MTSTTTTVTSVTPIKTTYSTPAEVDDAHSTLHATFRTGLTKDLAWRRWQLKQLWWMMDENMDRIFDALKADLNRHHFESLFTDIRSVKADIISHLKNLEDWTSTKPINTGIPLGSWLFKARIRKEPLGVAFIMGAWNYPMLLLLQPVISAITAGCCVLLKPSDLSVHSERLLQELVPKYLDPRAIRIVTGGPAETGYMLEKRFNHIFFTGSTKVGHIVAAAAAKHLTPVVLELGGQNPVIVHKTADIDYSARRIAFAKFQNAGQICLSVNHVFVDPEVADEFVERASYWCAKFVEGEARDHLTHIVNTRNFDRLCGLLDATSGKVVQGGGRDRETCYLQPTVVRDVTLSDPLMSEELFGPILPVITATPDEAIRTISSGPSPLALYMFARDDAFVEHVLDRTLSGGVTVNNIAVHVAFDDAPFGGVGDSGHGAYHGRHGVDSFVHRRPVVHIPSWVDRLLGFTYPPYSMDNAGKMTIKNSLGFKKGETMEDQRRVAGRGRLWYATAVGVGGVVAAVGARYLQA